mgnify:FL=1
MTVHDEPVPIAPVGALLGEGPVWVEREQALWWVDVEGRAVFRWREGDGVRRFATPLRVSALAPAAKGGFVAATEYGFYHADPEQGLFHPIVDPEAHLPHNRFNDGKVDRAGRFWAGTMHDRGEGEHGRFYRLDPDLSWVELDAGYRITNGPAFSADGRSVWHTDSARRTIYVSQVTDGGALADKRVFARFDESQGVPDGMTVDAENCLWVAFWDGWCVRRLSPAGDILQSIRLPVQRPTSVAFGGPALDRLFVTSARIQLSPEELAAQPLAGALFMTAVGVRGLTERLFG